MIKIVELVSLTIEFHLSKSQICFSFRKLFVLGFYEIKNYFWLLIKAYLLFYKSANLILKLLNRYNLLFNF